MACHCPECREYLEKITNPTPSGIIRISKHVEAEKRKDPLSYLPNYHIDNEKIEIKTSDVLEQLKKEKEEKPKGRYFESGAYRDIDEEKLDFEGFLSPFVIERYAEYMNSHRKQSDGKLRDSDNWQKGMPISVYMKSLYRHFFAVWKNHRGGKTVETQEENLCGVLFNAMGMLHELLKKEKKDGEN